MDEIISSNSLERTHSRLARTDATGHAHSASSQSLFIDQLLSIPTTFDVPTPEANAAPISAQVTSEDSHHDANESVNKPESDSPSDEQNSASSTLPTALLTTFQTQNVEATQVTSTQPIELEDPTSRDELESLVGESIVGNSPVQPVAKTIDTVTNAKPSTKAVGHKVTKSERSDSSVLESAKPTPIIEAPQVDSVEAEDNQRVNPLELAKSVSQKAISSPDQNGRRAESPLKWFERASEATSNSIAQAQTGNVPATEMALEQNDSASSVVNVELVSQALSATANTTSTNTSTSSLMAAHHPVGMPAASQGAGQSASQAAATSEATPASAELRSANFGQREAQTSTATGSRRNDRKTESTTLTQQERVRMIQRIARSFNRITSDGGQINLRLHPEQLGALSMQVKLDGRSMSARLVTETAAARDAILQDLQTLRQRLADQGFEVGNFQVEVSGSTQGSLSNTHSQHQSQNHDGASNYQVDYRRISARRPVAPVSSASPSLVGNTTFTTGVSIDLQV